MVSWIFFPFILICLLESTFAGDSVHSLEGQVSRRIVKGFAVDITSFPHAVFLHFDVSRPATCGSSLITTKTVLTSAHCLRELTFHKGGIYAFFGANIPRLAKVTRNVTTFKIHPKYNPVTARCDLALAMLISEVPIGKGIHKIPVLMEDPNYNAPYFTAGWGVQTVVQPGVLPRYSTTRSLMASKQKILTVAECAEESGLKLSPSYLCSIPDFGYHYRGDMGNGLVTTQPWMALVGVVSYLAQSVTVYTNMLNQRPWLRRTVKELYKNEPVDEDCC